MKPNRKTYTPEEQETARRATRDREAKERTEADAEVYRERNAATAILDDATPQEIEFAFQTYLLTLSNFQAHYATLAGSRIGIAKVLDRDRYMTLSRSKPIEEQGRDLWGR